MVFFRIHRKIVEGSLHGHGEGVVMDSERVMKVGLA